MEQKGNGPKPAKILSAALAVTAAVGIGWYLLALGRPEQPRETPSSAVEPASTPRPTPEPSPEPTPEPTPDPTADYPEGKLFITGERSVYADGEMTLSAPRLDLYDLPLLSDVEYETLKYGLGLYDYAQMPGEGKNRNVSIAGHRDVYGKEFYYIDTVTDGDELWLDWRGKRYVYRYRDTRVVEEDDWEPIRLQGFNCLTLTSCTPIGIASHRIIVRAELDRVEELPAESAASGADVPAED